MGTPPLLPDTNKIDLDRSLAAHNWQGVLLYDDVDGIARPARAVDCRLS
jgi:hypothetical protein